MFKKFIISLAISYVLAACYGQSMDNTDEPAQAVQAGLLLPPPPTTIPPPSTSSCSVANSDRVAVKMYHWFYTGLHRLRPTTTVVQPPPAGLWSRFQPAGPTNADEEWVGYVTSACNVVPNIHTLTWPFGYVVGVFSFSSPLTGMTGPGLLSSDWDRDNATGGWTMSRLTGGNAGEIRNGSAYVTVGTVRNALGDSYGEDWNAWCVPQGVTNPNAARLSGTQRLHLWQANGVAHCANY